jgi:hypothetical protein
MGRLSHAICMTGTNVGSPKERELNGHAGLVVVVGVTPIKEDGKAVHMGEGGQVIGYSKPRGMRNAGRRNGVGCPS